MMEVDVSQARSCTCRQRRSGPEGEIFPVDCEVEDWSLWSECSATCGGGTRTRERKVVKEPENGGAACQDREEEGSCKTEPCEAAKGTGTKLEMGFLVLAATILRFL